MKHCRQQKISTKRVMSVKINCFKKSSLTNEEFEISKISLKNKLQKNIKQNKNIKQRKKWSYSLNYQKRNLPNEKWKDWGKYKISTLGRVKFKDKIVPQKDKVDMGPGYLVLDKEKFNENVTKSIYVYRMVAETFLCKIIGDGYECHHITNDGYDNSVANLILLTKAQHREVHRK